MSYISKYLKIGKLLNHESLNCQMKFWDLTTCASLVCSSSIYRTFIKTLNELSYYKQALFLNLRELAQVVI